MRNKAENLKPVSVQASPSHPRRDATMAEISSKQVKRKPTAKAAAKGTALICFLALVRATSV